LQGVQELAGAPSGEGVVGQGSDDLIQPGLHLGEGLGKRSVGSERVVATDNAFGVLLTLVIAVMIEAEFLSAKSGRTAVEAIGLAMAADGKGHGCLLKRG